MKWRRGRTREIVREGGEERNEKRKKDQETIEKAASKEHKKPQKEKRRLGRIHSLLALHRMTQQIHTKCRFSRAPPRFIARSSLSSSFLAISASVSISRSG